MRKIIKLNTKYIKTPEQKIQKAKEIKEDNVDVISFKLEEIKEKDLEFNFKDIFNFIKEIKKQRMKITIWFEDLEEITKKIEGIIIPALYHFDIQRPRVPQLMSEDLYQIFGLKNKQYILTNTKGVLNKYINNEKNCNLIELDKNIFNKKYCLGFNKYEDLNLLENTPNRETFFKTLKRLEGNGINYIESIPLSTYLTKLIEEGNKI